MRVDWSPSAEANPLAGNTDRDQWSESDQSLHANDVPSTSALAARTHIISPIDQARKVPILLQKSFWGVERKSLETLMRFTLGDVRGPCGLIQNRSRTSVLALKSDAAAERSKDQLSRDF
jgi:hypothetical protein